MAHPLSFTAVDVAEIMAGLQDEAKHALRYG
jgi:hypothetical protein